MKRIKLIAVALFALFSVAAFAQNIVVSGVVVDESGQPVPGTAVLLPGTTRGAVTDFDGSFSFTAPATATMVKVSNLGYEEQEIPITGQPLRIVLVESMETLDEAVAIGYGSAKKIESLVGSVTTVNSQSIKNAPSSSALDMLQGQVAGLAVLTSGGVAGDNSVSMKLHGVGSLTSSSAPLYMIDGVPASARSIMALNPNDIESISILKDASATSIYGSRAANGVVYVITKTGSYNNNASVTFRSQYGISTVTDKALYTNMMTGPELAEFWNIAGIHSAKYIQETYYDKGFNADTRWHEYVQQYNNPQYQNDLTIEGGGQRVAYVIGMSQFHQRGSAIGNVYDRYTLRSNLQGRPKDWLKVGANLNFSYDRNIQNPNWSNSSNNRNYTSGALSYLIVPFYPAIDPETGKEYENEYPGGLINHHTYMKNRYTPTERLGIVGNIFSQVDFTRNLKYNFRAGVDGYISRYRGQMNPDYYLMGGSGWRSRTTAYSYTASVTNTLEYSFQIGNSHKFTLLAGQEGIFNDYDYWAASSEQITNPRIVRLQSGDASTYDVSESQSQSSFLSFFGHAEYTLMERYIFDATIRSDASSRFGADTRWGTFWSVGGMWRLKKEEFLKSLLWLNDLSFKMSYGTQGNAAIGDYQALGLLGGSSSSYNGQSGLYFAQPANPDLTWEKQGLLTVALIGKVIDRFDFDIEWYNRQTTDMLMSVPYPATTGFTSRMENVGGLRNRGIDITLGYDVYRSRDAYVRVGTTFNYNQEKITKLFNGLDRWEIEGTGIAYVVGHPVMYYTPIYAGVNRDTGVQQWYVPGDDVDVTTTEAVTEVFDEVALTQNTGIRRNAPIYGGFSMSGAWKSLSFMVDFAYVIGKYMQNNDMFFYANPNRFADNNQHKGISDFWTETNRDAKWPDWRQGQSMQFDTHILEDASFLRLKNLQVAYAIPQSVLSRQNVFSDVKFTFTGRNLLTFTKYSGIDPEDDTNVSLGLPANSKQILFGIEVTF